MDYISRYSGHQNSFRRYGKMLVSTFSGEHCLFGTSNTNDGWTNAVKSRDPVYFVPSFFEDPSKFKNTDVMDGGFNVSH
jgi:glucan endo-1,3-alpha-glucosidase